MRFIHMYLVGFLVLAVGALLALWKGGVLQHVSLAWIAICGLIAIGIGVMAAVSAGKPGITKE
jgi:hypothetical protein